MELVSELKVFAFLSFIVMILLWKFWKDATFKSKIIENLNELINSRDTLNKELETIVLEIDENSKKIDYLTSYLKRLDQNASRLADNIKGEQSMSKAIDMARKGMDHIDIVKETGLSDEEVEAIIHSHKE
tara:strand:- start:668 stop:1057 length:390 start_codon:yes stop_codon:yes gene_type:complete